MKINTYVGKKSKASLLALGVTLTLAVGVLDYITGSEIRIDVFYLLPISFVAWYVSKSAGIFISTISTLSIFLSDQLSNPGYHIHFVDLWNLTMIFIFLIVASLILSKLRETLYKQRQLSSELQKSINDVKVANESLEAFSYSVSHDLISPLWRIESYAHMITDKYSGKLDETGNNYLERIGTNIGRMRDLIDALLKLSQFTSGSLNRSKVDLTAMVRRGIDESAKVWPGRQIEIIIANGITADGDPTLLQVIIFNLAENALKFTKHRPVSKIEFGMTKIEGKEVYYIRDNGTGFSMKNADGLFKPFQRLHSGSEFSGFGIGLATVQRIVHRHGGRIWAESEIDKGSTFYFTLA
jgi:light-regulated signal transduction histidine kinase (bacteriophytochrome)